MSRRRHPLPDPLRSDADPELLAWALRTGVLGDRRRLRFLTPAQRVVLLGGGIPGQITSDSSSDLLITDGGSPIVVG